jgi:hypothetical protein
MTKLTYTFAALGSFAALTLAGDAFAQRERPEGDIEKEEMLERVQERFERMDTNGDGFIGSDEVGEGRRARFAAMMIERQDSNDDGFVSLEEMLDTAEARFDEADTDGDGVLSEEEREEQGGKRRGKGRRG